MKVKYRRIVNGILNGVKMEDGNIRKFDIIDYYSIASLSYKALFEIIKKELSVDEIRKFKQFCTDNAVVQCRKFDDCESLLNIILTVGVEFDEKGNIIEGSGKSVTYEDNEKLLNFLYNNNIPLCNKSMICAQRRYLMGDIKLDEVKTLIKK